jgi:hypothetical protein
MPEVFDAEMAAAGQPVRSFNVGVDGMRPPEDTYLLEQVLALRTKRLRFVIVECNPIRFKQREDDRNTLRAVYWHDWTRLATIARIAFFADSKKRSWSARYKKISTAWPDFADHLEYWMWNASHLGRGHEVAPRLASSRARGAPVEIGPWPPRRRLQTRFRPRADAALQARRLRNGTRRHARPARPHRLRRSPSVRKSCA